MRDNRDILTRTLPNEEQLSLFAQLPDPVSDRIRNLDLMDTTPSQALKILEELQEHLK